MTERKRLTAETIQLFKLHHVIGTSSIRIHQLAERVMEFDVGLGIILKIENEEILSAEQFLIFQYQRGLIGHREELN